VAILKIGHRAAIRCTVGVGAGGALGEAATVVIRGADNGAWARCGGTSRTCFHTSSGLRESDQALAIIARRLVAARSTHHCIVPTMNVTGSGPPTGITAIWIALRVEAGSTQTGA